MEARIDDSVTEKSPGLKLGLVVFRNVSVSPSPEKARALIGKLVGEAKEKLGKGVRWSKEYRDLYWSFGIDPTKYRPSAEALAKRIASGKELYEVNNVVDIANAVSVVTGFSIGIYDISLLSGNLVVRTARKGEHFRAIGTKGDFEVKGGEIVVSDSQRIIDYAYSSSTSDEVKVTESSKDIAISILAPQEASVEDVKSVLMLLREAFAEGLDLEPAEEIAVGKDVEELARKDGSDIGMTLKKSENLPEWYVEVVRKGGFADYSAVKGCMVVKPNGYFIWQEIQKFLDSMIIPDGVRNAYFPLLIPESLLKKEAAHFKGFTPEVAWTGGKTDDDGGERLAIRPTSETIICSEVAGWIRSHRDLPLRLNQWCSVLRWETKTTRLFLRTREFLWQEGHTFWADKPSAEDEVRRVLDFYGRVAEELLCMPVVKGIKTDNEKFAGAEYTTTIEAMMPDGRALQAGTSHHLKQDFMKVFGVKFLDEQNKEQYAHYNSWGISTRLIGGLLMLHGDDKGAVLPPRVAQTQAVVIPIYFKDSQKEAVIAAARASKESLLAAGVRAEIDERADKTPGWKFNQYELLGVPLRLEVGPKDVEKGQLVAVRRDTSEKSFVPSATAAAEIPVLLEKMQSEMLRRARQKLAEMTFTARTKEEFDSLVAEQKGFVIAPWCGDGECEKEINERTGASIRCIAFDSPASAGPCIGCGGKASKTAHFAKAY